MRSDPLSATLEDYLETVARLVSEDGSARVGDIARALSVHKSTVTAALKSLAEKGLVRYAPYEAATLTETGRTRAGEITERHRVVRCFLTDVLGVGFERADANACRIEHAADRRVIERLGLFAEFVHDRGQAGQDVAGRFRRYVRAREGREEGGAAAGRSGGDA
jgi:DtxR family Mn-dependent transcriptional regulator